jgi:hypothetical protein
VGLPVLVLSESSCSSTPSRAPGLPHAQTSRRSGDTAHRGRDAPAFGGAGTRPGRRQFDGHGWMVAPGPNACGPGPRRGRLRWGGGMARCRGRVAGVHQMGLPCPDPSRSLRPSRREALRDGTVLHLASFRVCLADAEPRLEGAESVDDLAFAPLKATYAHQRLPLERDMDLRVVIESGGAPMPRSRRSGCREGAGGAATRAACGSHGNRLGLDLFAG